MLSSAKFTETEFNTILSRICSRLKITRDWIINFRILKC